MEAVQCCVGAEDRQVLSTSGHHHCALTANSWISLSFLPSCISLCSLSSGTAVCHGVQQRKFWLSPEKSVCFLLEEKKKEIKNYDGATFSSFLLLHLQEGETVNFVQ